MALKIKHTNKGKLPEKGILVFRKFPFLTDDTAEKMKEVAALTGLTESEVRMRLIGIGVGALNIPRPKNELELLAIDMNIAGVQTTCVSEDTIKGNRLPPAANKVELSDGEVIFFDKQDNELLRLSEYSKLLVIVTDISGQSTNQVLNAMAYSGKVVERSFEETLRKISIGKPVAAIYDLKNPASPGIFINSQKFSYLGLEDQMTLSIGNNFQLLISQAIEYSQLALVDEFFGIASLPWAVPEWNGPVDEIKDALGVYCQYIIAAARANILTSDSNAPVSEEEMTAPSEDEKEEMAETEEDALLPPPDMEYSRLAEFFQTSIPEMIVLVIILFAPYISFSHIFKVITEAHLFWQIVFTLFITIAGLLLFSYALVLLNFRRIIENTPTSKIRSLSMGMVELAGRARQYYDLRTSATKTPCIYYRCSYYKLNKTSDGSSWSLTRQISSGRTPFYIEDETGRVLVRPEGSMFNVPMKTQSFHGSYIPALSINLKDENKKTVEDLVPVGVPIYVLGSAHTVKQRNKIKDRFIDKLRELKNNPDFLSQYDTNNDGRIDQEEWERARDDIEREVYMESLAEGATESEQVVIEKPKFGVLPFIISDSEEGLIGKLMVRTWVFFIGGILTLICSVKLIVRFF